jgi:hypothetical protein
MRRFARFAVLVGAASAALALAGPYALAPFKDVAGAATEVSVAFVVDFGGADKVQVTCAKVPSTDNEYEALAAFTQQESEASPTYNGSGLLCSIGGIPNSGCGQSDGSGFIYWSYWHGDTGTWEYSNTGASGTVHGCNAQGQDCDIEGWRFEDPGSGNPSDPPPEATADYAAICPATPPPTTTTSASPPTTAGSAVPSNTVPEATAAAPDSGGGSNPTDNGATPTSVVSPPPSHPALRGGSATTTPTTARASGSLPDSSATATTASDPNAKIQALGGIPAGSSHGGSGGAGSVWIAGALLLVLVAGSLYAWRRRARSP